MDVSQAIPDLVRPRLREILGQIKGVTAYVTRPSEPRPETTSERPETVRVRLDQWLPVDHEVVLLHVQIRPFHRLQREVFLVDRRLKRLAKSYLLRGPDHVPAILVRLPPIAFEAEQGHFIAVLRR